jgi:hypothetical protein
MPSHLVKAISSMHKSLSEHCSKLNAIHQGHADFLDDGDIRKGVHQRLADEYK